MFIIISNNTSTNEELNNIHKTKNSIKRQYNKKQKNMLKTFLTVNILDKENRLDNSKPKSKGKVKSNSKDKKNQNKFQVKENAHEKNKNKNISSNLLKNDIKIGKALLIKDIGFENYKKQSNKKYKQKSNNIKNSNGKNSKNKNILTKSFKINLKKNEKENKNNSYQKNRIQILIHEKTFTKTNLIKKHNIKNKIVTNLH